MTGTAVDSAIREAARRAAAPDRDVSRVQREVTFDRFLCRVFAEPGERFVLTRT